MKNGVRLVSAAVAAGLVGFMSLAAQAKDYTGDINDGVIAFGEITESSTITIASGTTVSNQTAITGAGSLAISGGGTLVMAAESPAYSGAITIDNTIVRLAAENPLGTGKVTLNGATAQLLFECSIMDGTKLVNEFEINDSTTEAQTFYFEYPNKIASADSPYLEFDGPLTVNDNMHLYAVWSNNVSYIKVAQFNNTVTAEGQIRFDSYTNPQSTKMSYYRLNGLVTAKSLYSAGQSSSYSMPNVLLYHGTNSIGKLVGSYKGSFTAYAEDAFGGAAITKTDVTRADLNLNGKDQTCAYVNVTVTSADQNSITTSSAATLTLTGGVASATSSKMFGLSGKLSLVIDDRGESGNFTQTFNGGQSTKGSTVMTTSGSIAVKRGNLAFTGSYKLASVPSISVDNGSFSLANTNETEKAFAGLTQLTIGANGSFSVNSKINPFPDEGLALDLTTGASITLTQDMTVDTLTLNGVSYPQGTHTTIFGCTLSGGSITVVNGPECPNPVFIDVGAGQTVTDPEGLTDDATLFKLGEGKLVLTGANGYTGGSVIDGGVVEAQNSAALGDGTITVEEGAQLVVGASLANDIVFNGDSTKEHPALVFDPGDNLDQTFTLSGDVTINGTTHFRTGWETVGTLAGGNTARVVFSGAVSGAKLAGAPHCRVSFTKSVQLNELQGYWGDNSANVSEEVCPTRGNLGSFFVSTATCGIDLIKLDQTRFVCGVAYCNTNVAYAAGSKKFVANPIVEFTGEHLCDGWGCYDMGGYAQGYYAKGTVDGVANVVIICAVHVRTADNVTFDSEGAQIVNTGSSATLYLGPAFNAAGKEAPSRAKIDGPGITLYAVDGVKLGARRHTVAGSLSTAYGAINFEDGCEMPNITGTGGSNSSSANFHQLGDGALPAFKSAGTASTVTHNMRPGVFPPRVLAVSYTGENSKMYVYADQKASTLGVLEVATATLYGINDKKALPAGRYTGGAALGLRGGTIIVFEGTSPQTPIVWTGATDSSLAAAANWSDGEGTALAEPPETYAPASLATFRKGTNDPQIDGEVNFYGLKFAGDEGMTVKEGENADLRLWQGGLVVEAGASARTFTVEPGVWFYKGIGNGSIVVPTGDTLVLEKGLVNATNVTVSGGGTLMLGGTIPAAITVTVGTLGFVEGATLPADDTAVLALGSGAKIVVPDGQIFRAKTLSYGGEVMPVGYYTDCVTGGGSIRVAESTAPAVPETLTWDHTGVGGLVSTRANWEGSPYFEFTFADKYDLVFAKSGSEAVVDGPINVRSLAFTGGDFTLKAGAADAAVEIGSGNVITAVSEEPSAHVYDVNVPLTHAAKSATEITANNDDTLYLTNGLTSAGNVLVTGTGTNYFGGVNVIDGSVKVNGRAVYLSGLITTSKGLDTSTATRLAVDLDATPADPESTVYFNGVTIEKGLYLRGRTTDTTSLRTLAGTTNIVKGPTLKPSPADHWYDYGDIEFAGGFESTWVSHKRGTGTMTFSGKPATFSGKNADALFDLRAGVVVFNVASNVFSSTQTLSCNGGSVRCGVKDVFSSSTRHFRVVNANSVFDTGVYDQHIQRIITSSGTLTGTYPAKIIITAGTKEEAKATTNICCNVTGGLGFEMAGTETWQLAKKAFTSHGDLVASSGVLELASDATWRNGTNFTARGTGTLKFTAAGQISGDFAQLHVADQGQVEIPSGVTLRVIAADLDGQPVNAGTYTAGDSGIAAHITGGGSLRVGKAGMMFIVK